MVKRNQNEKCILWQRRNENEKCMGLIASCTKGLLLPLQKVLKHCTFSNETLHFFFFKETFPVKFKIKMNLGPCFPSILQTWLCTLFL